MSVAARIRALRDATAEATLDATTATIDRRDTQSSADHFPAKEYSVLDDMMNVCDTASVVVANPGGRYSRRFKPGQRIEIDEQDSDVAGGAWLRTFTGRIVRVVHGSDASGGSAVQIDAQDLGWHLTNCDAPPLFKTDGITLLRLIRGLVDPTWGFTSTTTDGPDVDDNVLNKTLKQGRQGIQRAFAQKTSADKTVLPFIQVEPGQKPMDVLMPYLKRFGLLLNAGARGGLILFRPDYSSSSPYSGSVYHAVSHPDHNRNNVVGRVTLTESIDGLFTETQCWSTIVNPTRDDSDYIAQHPNAAYRKESYKPGGSLLPFYRLAVAMDGEAITKDMRQMRARWKYQIENFNSWQYEVELRGHSQNGALLVSDSMFPVTDTVHDLQGAYYLQSVRRSYTEKSGPRSNLVLRLPGLLDPALERQMGGGAKGAKR